MRNSDVDPLIVISSVTRCSYRLRLAVYVSRRDPSWGLFVRESDHANPERTTWAEAPTPLSCVLSFRDACNSPSYRSYLPLRPTRPIAGGRSFRRERGLRITLPSPSPKSGPKGSVHPKPVAPPSGKSNSDEFSLTGWTDIDVDVLRRSTDQRCAPSFAISPGS